MIERDLYTHLKNNVLLVDGRVYAQVMHQNTQKPALVYQVDAERSLRGGLACSSRDTNIEWSIHIYHTEYLLNKEIKNEVKAALVSFGHGIDEIVVSDGFDEESELFVQIIKFNTKES